MQHHDIQLGGSLGGEALLTVPETDVVEHPIREGRQKKAPRTEYPAARLISSLAIHLLGYVINLTIIIICFVQGQFTFGMLLLFFWLIVSFFCLYVALQDENLKLCKGLPAPVRLPLLWLIYGLLQGVQVQHIFQSYTRRTETEVAPSEAEGVPSITSQSQARSMDTSATGKKRKDGIEPSPYHSKTFDGIIEGLPFTAVSMISFFLLDGSCIPCAWYMSQDFTKQLGSVGLWRTLFGISGALSILSLAMGIVEVDYRVSARVRRKVESSFFQLVVHFMYRISEVTLYVSTKVAFFLFARPLMPQKGGSAIIGVPFLIMLVANFAIMVIAKPKGSPAETFVAHMIIGVVMLAANPSKFVDKTGYIAAAKQANSLSYIMNTVLVLIIIGICVFSGTQVFNNDCFADGWDTSNVTGVCTDKLYPYGDDYWLAHEQQQIGQYMLKFNVELFYLLGASAVSFLALSILVRRQRVDGDITDDAVLEMIPSDTGDAATGGVAVRRSVARGLSSYLLQVGTGLTNQLFVEDQQQLGDFVIERVVGTGAYGVVVLVKQRSQASQPIDSMDQRRYAMKMQNTESRRRTNLSNVLKSRAELADREREILTLLQHPFIVRLFYFFEVPDRQWKDSSTGEFVQDGSGNKRFHKAIVMEFCPEGDLDHHVYDRGFLPNERPYASTGSASLSGARDWVVRIRRFSAEIGVALMFVHQRGVTYRDLKPQNVLLKAGSDEELHICLTDFGFSKVSEGDTGSQGRLESLAGTPLYAAPEIMAIANAQRMVEYTQSVDLFSFGRTMLVCLWRTKLYTDQTELRMPNPEEYLQDPRVPEAAQHFINKVTDRDPNRRGATPDMQQQPFFGQLEIQGVSIPAIEWDRLMDGV